MIAKVSAMVREISAGGVVLREISGVWHVALTEPQKSDPQKDTLEPAIKSAKAPRKRSRALLGLPKGVVDVGEKPQVAAVREVLEETGIIAKPIMKLADNKYVYVRTWGDGAQVKQALWVPVVDAARQLAYSNERKVLRQAQDYVEKQGI
jgi:hypothetical protein